MEMNTRLQVEHPVTEAITGLDLVEWQFRITAGEKLPLAQHQVRFEGHAAEARLYAEDPEHRFLPSTGKLIALQFPKRESVRIDSGVEAGGEVTPFYDPMIAKVIAHGKNRDEALDRLADALDDTVVAGPRSNAGFLATLCRAPAFREADFDTDFIDQNLTDLGATPKGPDSAAIALGAEKLLALEDARIVASRDRESEEPASPWDSADAFQLSGIRRLALPILAEGELRVAVIAYSPQGPAVSVDGAQAAADAVAFADGDAVYVLRRGRQTKVTLRDAALDEAGDQDKSGLVRAPMHGKLLAILVEEGAHVVRGQRVAIIEAMKMEHTMVASVEGTIAEIAVAVDEQVAEGGKVMRIVPAQETSE
jgi:3-methylcrotonyl-CoA carboxylase alpha subunit